MPVWTAGQCERWTGVSYNSESTAMHPPWCGSRSRRGTERCGTCTNRSFIIAFCHVDLTGWFSLVTFIPILFYFTYLFIYIFFIVKFCCFHCCNLWIQLLFIDFSPRPFPPTPLHPTYFNSIEFIEFTKSLLLIASSAFSIFIRQSYWSWLLKTL